ncbi:IS21-like element helper ATPase IstB [Exiguobacterium mexicanum]|uniref:IS21-like element helper ATPase IstB n=1 Tax=Exiguobacterium mexicanum TaxID=340146 RepID=UPI0037BF08D0
MSLHPIEGIQKTARGLRLVESAAELPVFLRRAEQERWTYHELLHEVFSYEQGRREQKLQDRLTKWANFPVERNLDEFDLGHVRSLTIRQLNQLRQLSWLDSHHNLILLGPPGTGKTHLAIGLGVDAIKAGRKVSFVTMGEALHIMKTRTVIRRSEVRYKRLVESDLVILDDMMYMAMEQREANLLFHLINELYEQSSIILTSNKRPESWGELVGEQGIVTAILDRLLHRAKIIQMDEESYRMRNRSAIFEPEMKDMKSPETVAAKSSRIDFLS